MQQRTAIEHNGWTVVTGQDFRQKFLVRDPSQPKIGNPDYDPALGQASQPTVYPPFDLTGWTARMDLRVGPTSSSDLLHALESGLGITLGSPDPVDGTVEVFIDNTDTKSPEFLAHVGKRAYYDLFLIGPNPGDDNYRLLYGTIPVVGAVTDV